MPPVCIEGPDGQLWVEPRTLGVTQVAGGQAATVEGEAALEVLCDVLARLPNVAAVLDALSRLDPDPPVVLEALTRVTRLYLAASGRVVEVRPARDGRPLTVRVESAEASRRALDTRLRLASKEEVLELLSPALLLPEGALGLAGRVVVAWASEGARLPPDAGAAVLTSAFAGRAVEAIDDALLPFVALLGRRERFDGEVRWRLVDAGLDVVWRRGEVAVCAAS